MATETLRSRAYPAPFWRVLIQSRGAQPAPEAEPHIRAFPLTLRSFEDTPAGAQTFKVGGAPSWAKRPEFYTCACSADLVYVCQAPENMDFAVHPGQPEQPDSVRPDAYGLFLGNEVYLLACPDRCDPAAVWPVDQNRDVRITSSVPHRLLPQGHRPACCRQGRSRPRPGYRSGRSEKPRCGRCDAS